MIKAHVAHAVNGGFDIFNGIPGQLTISDLGQLLVKLIIKLEKVVQLLTVDGDALLMKILFQQVTLVVINQRGGAAYHCALNRLTDKTAVPHLRKGNFIYIAAALRADLNQTVLCKFNECFAHRLTRDIKTDGYLFLRE